MHVRKFIEAGQEKIFQIKKPLLSKWLVPGTGIEPAHPCERQILSLLRLPIPPSGQKCQLKIRNYQMKISGGNITHSIDSVQNQQQIFFQIIHF